MTHRQGPTKKLVPAISSESKCPHEYSEEDGLQLEIDCSDCQGAQDLSNRKCVSGILNVISASTEPDAIILKRFIHKRYRGEPVKRVAAMASELATLNRAIASAERPSDRRCRTCPASAERVLDAARRMLLENPLGYLGERRAILSGLRAAHTRCECTRADACVEAALSTSLLHEGVV
jgi:hypothetical protein